jgi:hypothetical protein
MESSPRLLTAAWSRPMPFMLPDDLHESKAENKQVKNRKKRNLELGHNKVGLFKGLPNYEIEVYAPV